MQARSDQANPNTHIPNFATVLLDNFKTTGVYAGCIAAPVPAIAGGVVGFLWDVLFGKPLEQTKIFAAAAGIAVGVPVGIAAATVFSLPFAVSALLTRKFLPDDQIQDGLELIDICDDPEDQARIIKTILEQNDQDTSLGIRSYESYKLILALEDNNPFDINNNNNNNKSLPIKEKWKALSDYMSEQSNNAYANNGKKLFNMILNVIKKNKNDQEFLLRNRLRKAVKDNEVATVNELIYNDLEDKDSKGIMSPSAFCKQLIDILNYAIMCDKQDIVEYLLNNFKEQIDLKQILPASIKKDFHPMHLAAKLGHTKILFLLLQRYYPNDLNEADNNGFTPLMAAACHGHQDTVEMLVQYADLNMTCKKHTTTINNKFSCYEKTALQLAAIAGHEDIANYLAGSQAQDPDTDQKKSELKSILAIIQSPKWVQEGWGLFCNHVPDRVQALKDYLQDSLMEDLKKTNTAIDSWSREKTLNVIGDLQRIVGDFNIHMTTKQGKLYTLINNIGHNLSDDFKPLKKFTPEQILSTNEMMVPLNK